MSKDKQHLTSVKVDKVIFDDFRVRTIRTKFSLQKLVDRAMYLYINDESFRTLIHNTTDLATDGEKSEE
jgi:hypothetical protein